MGTRRSLISETPLPTMRPAPLQIKTHFPVLERSRLGNDPATLRWAQCMRLRSIAAQTHVIGWEGDSLRLV
jgi:hypothetical protein